MAPQVELIGKSQPMLGLVDLARRVAGSNATVLIEGETAQVFGYATSAGIEGAIRDIGLIPSNLPSGLALEETAMGVYARVKETLKAINEIYGPRAVEKLSATKSELAALYKKFKVNT